ncbi:uncharacterized protein LOC114259732 [Camellia sinensis]|uniref:uncharacterized protein LOC114259732 n=1 Tax=Camellia sinensis TaxID=4442 RepID=UPI0010368050|nr:uncharacterized protein LOC114259732 [Camellia sinensis]
MKKKINFAPSKMGFLTIYIYIYIWSTELLLSSSSYHCQCFSNRNIVKIGHLKLWSCSCKSWYKTTHFVCCLYCSSIRDGKKAKRLGKRNKGSKDMSGLRTNRTFPLIFVYSSNSCSILLPRT